MKTRSLLIDTGAFYSRYVAQDQYHQESLSLWKKIGAQKIPCITTNFILSEFIALIVYRFGTKQALQAAREIYMSHTLRILPISLEIELKALDWMERFSDQDFSMTDATSFALMEERKITTAFTFDHHFEVAGYQRYL